MFFRSIWGTWPRWPPGPYMVKMLQKSSSPVSKGQWPWALVCSIRVLGPSKFFSNEDLGLTLTCPLCFYMGKSVRKSFNGRNLQQMTRVTWGICLHKNSDTRGLSAPAPGLYTCIKTWKIMYKIRLQRYLFFNLQQMGKVTRFFCWRQDFVFKGLSAPAPGLYIHVEKTLKRV